MTTLIVSPHLDDAVLSLAGTIQALEQGGQRVVVATVFSEGDSSHAVRRAEDRAALALLGAEALHLGLQDAPWRRKLPQTFRALVLSPLAADDAEIAPVAETLKSVLARVEAEQMLLPLGVGDHLDHRVVHATHRHLPGRVGFYEDRPYGLVRHAVAARLRALGVAVVEPPASPRSVDELVASALETAHVCTYLRDVDAEGQVEALRELARPLLELRPTALRLSTESLAFDGPMLDLATQAVGAYRSQLSDLFGPTDLRAALARHAFERIHWRA